MTDEQKQRIWNIENSCDGRMELAERIVALEDAYAQKVKSSDDYMMQLMSCEISLDGMHLIYGIMSDRYDEVIDLLRDARDEYVDLRDELEQWHRLTANIELPEYPITEFQPKDLERENAELRKQVHWLKRGDILHVLTDQELTDQQKHEREVQESITALDDENAKLREESSKYHDLYVHAITDAEVWHLQWSAEHQENTKLRSELESVGTAAYLYGRGDLQAENAKLRELVTFYLGCLTKGHVNCDSCAFSGEDNCDHGRKVIESAKQVGIEVNG